MTTYFISDLHLTPERPAVINGFFDFLKNTAPKADQLYILGDLFEYWIGDDAAELLNANSIIAALEQVSSVTDGYFMVGNRDFLVGNEFSNMTGFKLIDNETVIDLYGTPTLLLHGDTLCTDDVAHMQFLEQMVTNQVWRDEFLALPIPERIEQAKMARMASHEHKQQVSMEIMDVTESSVINAFERHSVLQMIHGHTHRQNIHKYDTVDGEAKRYVLGDWHKTGSLLTADDQGTLEITNFDI